MAPPRTTVVAKLHHPVATLQILTTGGAWQVSDFGMLKLPNPPLDILLRFSPKELIAVYLKYFTF